MATSPLARAYAGQKPPLGTPLDPSHPLARGLVGFWTFAERGGASLTNAVAGDAAAFGFTTPAWVAAPSGGAVNFPGQPSGTTPQGYVITQDYRGGAALPAALTLSCWVRVNSAATGGAFLHWGQEAAPGATTGECGVSLGVGSGTFGSFGNNLVGLYDGVAWKASSAALGTGWCHVALAASGGACTLYLNGAPVVTLSGTAYLTSAAVAPYGRVWIGGYYTGNGATYRYPDCRIAQAAVHSRSLSAAEVMALYAAPYQMFLAGGGRSFFSGGAAWSQALTDSFALSDALRRGAGKALADAPALSDALAKAFARAAMAEALSLADAGSRGAGKPASESLPLSDTRTTGAGKSAAESLPLSDARTAGAGKGTSETWTLADARAMGIGRGLAESLTLSDLRALAASRGLSDALALSDLRSSGVARPLSDSLPLSDALSVLLSHGFAVLLSEPLTLADGRTLGVGKAVAEALSLADARGAGASRQLADALALVESLARSAGFARTLADSLGISDALAATLAQVIAFALRGRPLPDSVSGSGLPALLTGRPLPPPGAESLDGTPLE